MTKAVVLKNDDTVYVIRDPQRKYARSCQKSDAIVAFTNSELAKAFMKYSTDDEYVIDEIKCRDLAVMFPSSSSIVLDCDCVDSNCGKEINFSDFSN